MRESDQKDAPSNLFSKGETDGLQHTFIKTLRNAKVAYLDACRRHMKFLKKTVKRTHWYRSCEWIVAVKPAGISASPEYWTVIRKLIAARVMPRIGTRLLHVCTDDATRRCLYYHQASVLLVLSVCYTSVLMMQHVNASITIRRQCCWYWASAARLY